MSRLPKEDISKLHSEINQLLNQRFVLATTSITIFGLVTAITPRAIKDIGDQELDLIYLGTVFILIFLAMLSYWASTLENGINLVNAYLINDKNKASQWEKDIKNYFDNRKPHSSFYIWNVFFALGIASMIWPVAVEIIKTTQKQTSQAIFFYYDINSRHVILASASILYLLILRWFSSDRREKNTKETISKAWDETLAHAPVDHNKIMQNCIAALLPQLQSKHYRLHSADVKLRIEATPETAISTAAAHLRFTADAYLAWEAEQAGKHEFVRGEVFAMTGTSVRHNLICGNLFAHLHAHLRQRPCRVFIADIKLRVDAADAYFYPDLLVTCSTADRAEPYVMREPCVVVEVLSPSTAAYDQGAKFAAYRQLASLREYVLIDPDTVSVNVFRRGEDGHWVLWPCAAGEIMELPSLGLSLPVDDLYAAL